MSKREGAVFKQHLLDLLEQREQKILKHKRATAQIKIAYHFRKFWVSLVDIFADVLSVGQNLPGAAAEAIIVDEEGFIVRKHVCGRNADPHAGEAEKALG